jgi:SHS2 domain-containing protein
VKNKPYEFIEHTADIGIRVGGDSLEGLFKNASLAMFDIIAETKPSAKRQAPSTQKITIRQKADSIDELFINWLNELLSLSATKELVFSDFQINNLDKNNLEAVAIGKGINSYRINTEIKAATYHQLKIVQNEYGWQAEVIFDV